MLLIFSTPSTDEKVQQVILIVLRSKFHQSKNRKYFSSRDILFIIIPLIIIDMGTIISSQENSAAHNHIYCSNDEY